MIKRICNECKIEKTINGFTKSKNRKLGISYTCKKCMKIYRENNKIKISELNKKYRTENSEKIKRKDKIYYEKNKKKINKRNRGYRKKNAAKIAKLTKIYAKLNSRKIKKRQKEWYLENKSKILERTKIYVKNKRINNPIFKLTQNISHAINRSLKFNKNGRHWEDLVGYTQGDLRKHLEIQFKDGMTWDNYGRNGWNIDHKIPVSLFNIQGVKSKGFKACWVLENLQPMWEKDNFKKHNILFY